MRPQPLTGGLRRALVCSFIGGLAAFASVSRAIAADIYPGTYFSTATKTVAHYGYDVKQPGRELLSVADATEIFVNQKFTVLRVPIYAMAHSNATTISDFTKYDKIVTTIQRVKAAKPSVKIFANVKLEGEETYPAWLDTASGGIHPTNYAKVIQKALAFYKAETGYDADFIGPLCEQGGTEYQFTQGEFTTIVNYLRANVPNCGNIIGPDHFQAGQALPFVNALKNNGNFGALDYVGTHYKNPELSALIDLADAAGTKPLWNTESQGWDQIDHGGNINDIEICLAELVESFDRGARGLVWWAYSWADGDVKSEVKKHYVRTTLGAHSVKITGSDPTPTSNTDLGKLYFRAYRDGTKMSLWIVNRKADYISTPLTFTVKGGETISGSLVAQRRWDTNASITSGFASRSGNTISVTMPRYTVAVVEFTINP